MGRGMIQQCVVLLLPWGGIQSKSEWCHWLTVGTGEGTCKGEPVAIPSIIHYIFGGTRYNICEGLNMKCTVF